MTGTPRNLIEGQPVLIVIDIQGGESTSDEPSAIPFMPGYADTLFLIGGHTDVCVHYTFVDAHQHDYFTRVIEDCVAGSSLDAHEGALRAMEYLQTGARRMSDEVVAAFEQFASGSCTPAP